MKIRIKKTVCLELPYGRQLPEPAEHQLRHTLPSNFTKKVGIEKVRVYLACENVWYWSKRQGFDPQLLLFGSDEPGPPFACKNDFRRHQHPI